MIVVSMLLSFAVGCGGNEAPAPPPAAGSSASAETTATTTTAPTAAASVASASSQGFVAAANTICKRMQRDAENIASNAKPSDAELGELVDNWRSAVEQLDALEPPQERKHQFRRMLAHYRNTLRALELMIEAKDETVLAAVAGVAVEGQRGSRAAREAGLPACALFPEIKQPPADKQPLYDATRDLVPTRARITRDGGLECDTSDSCRIEYELRRSIAERLREARALLRRHGWTNIRSGRMPTGGSWIMANRNDYAVTVEFVGDKLPEHCGGRVTYGCTDGVWVHRVEVPDVLTGG